MKSVVKVCCSTVKLLLLLSSSITEEVGVIRVVAENCVNIKKYSYCEGCLLDCN